ncbi:hypothetical protein ACHAPT_009283 [Fusarium lateritium]
MPSNDPVYQFKATLQVESTGSFVDLAGGGGQNPAQNNAPNQTWEFYSVPGFETRVVIKSAHNKSVLYANASNDKVQAGDSNVWDAGSQWYFEGAPVDSFDNGIVIRLRNVKYPRSYLDLSQSNKANGTPIIAWGGHSGTNQAFKITKV